YLGLSALSSARYASAARQADWAADSISVGWKGFMMGRSGPSESGSVQDPAWNYSGGPPVPPVAARLRAGVCLFCEFGLACRPGLRCLHCRKPRECVIRVRDSGAILLRREIWA